MSRREHKKTPEGYFIGQENYSFVDTICEEENGNNIKSAELAFEEARKNKRSISVWIQLINHYQNSTDEDEESRNQKIGIIYLLMAGIVIDQPYEDNKHYISHNFSRAAFYFRKSGDAERANNVIKLSEQYKRVAR
jgi:hypothetical protein